MEPPVDVLDEGDGTPANEDPRPFSRPPRLDLVTGIPVVPGTEKASHVYLTPDGRQVLDAYLLTLAAPGERRQLMRVARRILLDLATGRARLVREG